MPKDKSRPNITLAQYQRLVEHMAGVCEACGSERSGCEPDARRYTCESCGERQVYGPHEFMMSGRVVI